MPATEVYVSHAWGGESDEILKKVVNRLEKEKIKVIYDHKDLKYRGKISTFMEELGKSKAVIIIVSNKYLHSEYCMFELLQIYKNNQFLHRIFPIVLDEVTIAKSTDRLELVKYWESQSKELENKIRELDSLSYIEGITEDLDLYKNIRNQIAKLTNILRDINTLNIRLHSEENFASLVQQIKEALSKKMDTPAENQLEWRQKVRRRSILTYILAAAVVIAVASFAFLRPNPAVADNEIRTQLKSWDGSWNQELQGAGGTIKGKLNFKVNDLLITGVSTNIYPDKTKTSNELFDIQLDAKNHKIKGKWRSKDIKNQEGTFELTIGDKSFHGFYTLGNGGEEYFWNGKK